MEYVGVKIAIAWVLVASPVSVFFSGDDSYERRLKTAIMLLEIGLLAVLGALYYYFKRYPL